MSYLGPAYLTKEDVERMFPLPNLPNKTYATSIPATWLDKTPHPSFNTPRRPWSIVPAGLPLGYAIANTPAGDVVPTSTDYGMKSDMVAGETIRAGQWVTIDANGRVVPCNSPHNSDRKEGSVPKYTSVTTKFSGFVFRVTAKIPHPTLNNLVLIPIEGDLFTVERNDEWNIGDYAMYIAPGEHFCGEGLVGRGAVYPAVAFLFGNNRGTCQTVNTKSFAGVPSRGFITKPPKDYPSTATPFGIFGCWESEQREAAREAMKKAEEATKKLEAEFKATKDAGIAAIADVVGRDARQRYIDRANGKLGNSIRLVALRGGKARLEVMSLGSWRPLDHIKVTNRYGGYVPDGQVVELARW